jgi:hypothetical protein
MTDSATSEHTSTGKVIGWCPAGVRGTDELALVINPKWPETAWEEYAMKRTLTRCVISIAAGAALVLSGSGIAAASPAEGNASTAGPTAAMAAAADQLQQVRDQLADAVDAVDFAAMGTQADEAKSLLAGLISGKRAATDSEVVEKAKAAAADADAFDAQLARSADPLAMLNAAAQALLASLAELIDSILGSGLDVPDGLPEAPDGLPEVPDDGLPEVPDDDLPEPPDPGLP